MRRRSRKKNSKLRNDDSISHWVRRKAGPFSLERTVMTRSIADLTEALARNAEAVCRHYLPEGQRQGRYWMIGDVRGTPGQSMFA